MILRYENSDNKGKEIEVSDRGLIIGRYNGCDLQIDEDGISRKHCQVKKVKDSFIIEDLESTNGVKVNSEKVDSKQILEHDDILQVGKYRFLCICKQDEVEKTEEIRGTKKLLGATFTVFLVLVFLGLISFLVYLIKLKPDILS
jgi:pSer/pThr/pTyr-binding forkhead associated (FHA) protein